MRPIADQQRRYERIWEQNRNIIGEGFMQKDEDNLYCIGFWLKSDLDDAMEASTKDLSKALDPAHRHCWVTPHELHVTLSLPGRMGKQFEAGDIPNMIDRLSEVSKEFSPFSISIGDINCFPEVLFREIYNDDGNLFTLHERIMDEIPWSETPQYTRENFTPHMSVCYLRERHPHFLPEGFERQARQRHMKVHSVYLLRALDIIETEVIADMQLETGIITTY